MQELMRPLPVPNEDTQPFWDGCRHHKLLIQQCANCGTYRHYPVPACYRCNSFDTDWVESSGRGTVHSFAICHRAFDPWFTDKIPYNLVLVELDDIPGIRMVSNLVDCKNEEIYIGMPVEPVWEDVTEAISLYKFCPALSSRD